MSNEAGTAESNVKNLAKRFETKCGYLRPKNTVNGTIAQTKTYRCAKSATAVSKIFIANSARINYAVGDGKTGLKEKKTERQETTAPTIINVSTVRNEPTINVESDEPTQWNICSGASPSSSESFTTDNHIKHYSSPKSLESVNNSAEVDVRTFPTKKITKEKESGNSLPQPLAKPRLQNSKLNSKITPECNNNFSSNPVTLESPSGVANKEKKKTVVKKMASGLPSTSKTVENNARVMTVTKPTPPPKPPKSLIQKAIAANLTNSNSPSTTNVPNTNTRNDQPNKNENSTSTQTRGLKSLQRPKIKPPPPIGIPTSSGPLANTPQKQMLNVDKLLQSNTESNIDTIKRGNGRVVRKPSLKPPPPPISKPQTSQNGAKSTEIIQGLTTTDNFQLPRMPAMPPPSPPKSETPIFFSNETENDEEKFDQLYEEIQQTFNVSSHFEEQYNLSPNFNSYCKNDAENASSSKSDKYIPKYRKKTSVKNSPPDYYRSSVHTNIKSPTKISSSQINQPSTSSMVTECDNTSSLRQSRQYDILDYDDQQFGVIPNLPENGDSKTCPIANSQLSSHSRTSAEFRQDIVLACQDLENAANAKDRDEKRLSYRQARLRRHQGGRFDTWSSPLTVTTPTMSTVSQPSTSTSYYGSHGNDEDPGDEYGNISVDNYFMDRRDNSESPQFCTDASIFSDIPRKIRYTPTRRPLSELWRFKSEIQLNLTKKMNRIRLKVENTVASNNFAGNRHSIFYLDSTIHHPNANANANHSSLAGEEWAKPGDVVDWDQHKRRIAFGSREECIYGDDWSTSSDEEEDFSQESTHPNKSAGKHSHEFISVERAEQTHQRNSSEGDKSSQQQTFQQQQQQQKEQQQKSLLAEIESAYFELELKCKTKDFKYPSGKKDSAGFMLLEKNSTKTNEISRLSNLRAMHNDEEMYAEKYDQMRNDPQIPSSSSSLSSITDSNENNGNSEKSSTVTAPSSDFSSTLKDESAEDEDEMEDEVGVDSRSIYMSVLPEPQPLYQHYMKQEQDRLFKGQHEKLRPAPTDDSTESASSTSTCGVVNGTNTIRRADGKVADTMERVETSLSTVLENSDSDGAENRENSLKATVTSPAPLAEEHEADSVCDSNEPDDIASVSVRRQSSSASTDSGRGADTLSHVTSNTSMRRERLTAGSVYGSQRSLWCELPEVKSAGLLDSLDKHSKRLQEAYFEVITSEASYLRSINVLITNFMASPELLGSKALTSIISTAERKQLFSNIQAIRDCSERLLCDLESRLKENLILSDVCDILCEHFEKHFDAYVKYCSNQVYQDRTLKRLKLNNSQFLNCVQKIESDRQCQGLDMRSFLMLPMQRITRYPLLIYAVIDSIDPASQKHTVAARALILANQVVRNCNEGARRMERTEQLLEIERRLIYKSADLKRIPLVSSGRYVVKSGLVTQLSERSRSKTKLNMLQSKQRARGIFFFLFNDLLLIAKRKPNGMFVCKDYAARRFIVIEPVEPHSNKVPAGAVAALTGKPHLFLCILMHNARGKQVELLLNTDSESDRERWLSAMRPPTCANPDEKIYAEWDCPQAIVAHNYEAGQEDELDLENGDLVNILRKMPDGWFYGERTRDGKGGWFPSSYVQLILNDHVRANNYRQRLRVIQAVSDYRLQHQNTIRDRRAGTKRASLPASALLNTTFPSFNNPQQYDEHCALDINQRQPQEHLIISRLKRLSNPKALFSTASD